MNEFQDWLDIHSILFTFFQNISIFLFLHIIMDLRFSDFMYVHTTTGTILLLMLKLSELWSVETFFRLASISSWRDLLIFENVLPFWTIKIFQAHLVLLCATHRIRLFPQWTLVPFRVHWEKKIIWVTTIWTLHYGMLFLDHFSEQSRKRYFSFFFLRHKFT